MCAGVKRAYEPRFSDHHRFPRVRGGEATMLVRRVTGLLFSPYKAGVERNLPKERLLSLYFPRVQVGVERCEVVSP